MFPKIMRLIFVLLYTSFIVAGSYLGSNSDEFEPNYYYQDDYEGPGKYSFLFDKHESVEEK